MVFDSVTRFATLGLLLDLPLNVRYPKSATIDPPSKVAPWFATLGPRLYTVSQKTSPMFLAITRESIVGFS